MSGMDILTRMHNVPSLFKVLTHTFSVEEFEKLVSLPLFVVQCVAMLDRRVFRGFIGEGL